MMAVCQYKCTGAETKVGGRTLVPINPASGYEITNLFVNGAGVLIEADYVSGALPVASISGSLNRGDVVKILYKVIPRWVAPEPPAPEMMDFAPSDFSSTDFF